MITGLFSAAGLLLLLVTGLGVFVKIDDKLIGRSMFGGHARPVLFFYSVAMVACAMALAYLTQPYAGSDMSRYYYELASFQMAGWQYGSESLYATTPLTCLFMFLVAQTGDFQLFPCISAGLAVGAWMLVINDQVRTYGLSTRVFFGEVAVALAVNQILSLLIGGRQHLALCLLLVAVWYDLKPRGRGAKNHFLAVALYVVPPLIHYGVAPVYLARLLLFFLKGRPTAVAAVAAFAVSLTSGAVLEFLDSAGVGGDYLHQIASKFFGYEEISVADGRLMALSVATVLLFLALGYIFHREARERGEDGGYPTMVLITLVVAGAFVTNYHLSERVLAFCLYGFYPVLMWVAARRKDDVLIAFVFAAIVGCVALHAAYQLVSIMNQWVPNLNWV